MKKNKSINRKFIAIRFRSRSSSKIEDKDIFNEINL